MEFQTDTHVYIYFFLQYFPVPILSVFIQSKIINSIGLGVAKQSSSKSSPPVL